MGITPHHSFLLYIQVSSFSDVEMISSGLSQSFKNASLVVSLLKDQRLLSRISAKGDSFLHSAVVITNSPKQPDCVIATKDATEDEYSPAHLLPAPNEYADRHRMPRQTVD